MTWVEHCLVIDFGGFSLDGGLRILGTENTTYLDLIKHLENEGSIRLYVVGDFGEIDEDGHVVGETDAAGPVVGENSDVGPFYEDIDAVGPVEGENNDVGHVYEDIVAAGQVVGENNVVGPVVGETNDEVNVDSERVGRLVNTYNNDITTDIAESDEESDSESEDFSSDGWLSGEADEEITQIFDNKRRFKNRNLGDEQQGENPKHTNNDSQGKEASVEDESSDTNYIESDDLGNYETDYEGEVCVKKGKKISSMKKVKFLGLN
ncbi:hypothetical protein V6N11_082990 [Hibiscus sabdariffa]|uniref:Uncharacterized protein n=1 Tax=Hibiscus sabdariffa TaxID=183260 RepID=A0ABR2QKJ1_9ROSI